MPRKTATYVTCDGPNCKNIAEVADLNEAPDGWYRIIPEKDGKYTPNSVWEFHSLDCIAKWAKGRKAVLAGAHVPYTRSGNNKTGTNTNEQTEEQIKEILEAFKMEPGYSFSVTELSELTNIERSSVARRVDSLVEAQEVVQTEERRGPYPARYKFAS